MSEGSYIRVYVTIDKENESHTYETDLSPMAFVEIIGNLIDREISGFSGSIKPPDKKRLH